MMQTIEASSVKGIMRAVNSRKKKAFLSVATTVTLTDSYWSGGSRSTYVAVDIATGRTMQAPQYNPPQFGGPRTDPVVEIPPGVVIVEVGTFCGKPATPHIFIRPENMARLLPGAV